MNKFKTYTEAREFVASLTPRGIVPGLDTIRALCARLGDPQDKIKTIHIAGTNGKGSVGAFISSVLQADGKSVGRYATPVVAEYREIITINGVYISEADYAALISEVAAAVRTVEAEGMYPTSFEAETAAAFLYFYRKNCDYALIECGMGGALDATNVIKRPEAAVIVSISMDHMSYLGDTISEIAENKAGIIKQDIPVFSARQCAEAASVLKKHCGEGQLHIAEEPVIKNEDIYGTIFDYGDTKDIYIPLAGAYQPCNAASAIDVCNYLGVNTDTIKKGLRDTKWLLRFEADNDGWIFDGAHNEDAARRLRETVDRLLDGKRLAYIVGIFKDKAYDEILGIMAPRASVIYTVKPPTDRGLSSSELAKAAEKYCKNVIAAESTAEAVRLCAVGDYDNVLVFGSLSFLADLKREKELIYEQMSKNN